MNIQRKDQNNIVQLVKKILNMSRMKKKGSEAQHALSSSSLSLALSAPASRSIVLSRV